MKSNTILEGDTSEAVICMVRIAGHKLSFFFFLLAEPAEEPEGQMCRERIGPPKKWVCDGPQMKCPREQLHKNDPVQFLAFLFLPRFLSEVYWRKFYLGTLPRNTLPENLQKSLGKGKKPSWNRKEKIQDRPAQCLRLLTATACPEARVS